MQIDSRLERTNQVDSSGVRDAALMMEQREGNSQPLAWRHARGTTYLGADPASGHLTIRGGQLDLDRPAVARGGLLERKGISATEFAPKNLRGISIAVTDGQRTLDVKFAEAEPRDPDIEVSDCSYRRQTVDGQNPTLWRA